MTNKLMVPSLALGLLALSAAAFPAGASLRLAPSVPASQPNATGLAGPTSYYLGAAPADPSCGPALWSGTVTPDDWPAASPRHD